METIIVHTVAQELQYRYARENVPGKIVNGEMIYLHQGMWVDRDAYNILYPEAVYQKPNKAFGTNPCKKNEWLKNNKAY